MKFLSSILSTIIAACLLVACSSGTTGTVPIPAPSSAAAASASTPAGINLDSQVADARAFVEKMAAGDFAGAIVKFDDTLRGQLDAVKLKDVWFQLLAQAGDYQSQAGTRTEVVGIYSSVYVTCTFTHSKMDVQVTFNARGQIAGLHFVPVQPSGPTPTVAPYTQPSYAVPSRFRETDVTVGSGEWALPGTLSLPTGSGPFPAVVLVHSSGANDRNETIGPNQPFKDLAWGLASQGIAVLRYDKRTLVYHQKITQNSANTITIREDTIDDALLAVQLLRQNPAIDPHRIYVLGHSLGGMLTPWILKEDPQIAGGILLAANSRPLEDVYYDQMTYIYSLNGGPSEAQKAQLDKLKAQAARVKDPGLTASTPSTDLPMNAPASWWLSLKGYDPVATARALGRPLLVLWGARDYQVPQADFNGWQSGLSGVSGTAVQSFPTLNHMMIAGTRPSTPQEFSVPGHVDETVIRSIVGWIKP